MDPEITAFRLPCIRCSKLRRLSLADQLCWLPRDAPKAETSCWRAARQYWIEDRASALRKQRLHNQEVHTPHKYRAG